MHADVPMIRKQNGSGLVVVLIALAVVTILSGAIANMVMANLKLTKHQENGIKAYYLALTGVDLGVAALLQEGVFGETDTLLQKHFSVAAHANVADAPVLQDTVPLDGGETRIEIRAVTVSGQRWVRVYADGVLTGGQSRSTALRMLAANPSIVVREQN